MDMDMVMVMDPEDIITAAAAVGQGRIRVGIKGLRGWDRAWVWEDRADRVDQVDLEGDGKRGRLKMGTGFEIIELWDIFDGRES